MRARKKVLAREFADNEISFEDLVKILDYKEARKITFYVDKVSKSFKEGLK